MTFEAPSFLCLSAPDASGHKYDRGHAAVVSGPRHATGAARLAAMAALRVGAGLVTVASSGSALATNAAHLTAIMLKRMDETDDMAAWLSDGRITAAAIGMGLGLGASAKARVLSVMRGRRPTVLDADALTVFASDPRPLFDALQAPAVLTPHAGEFARLFETGGGRERQALAAARSSGAVIVLKGPATVIAAPDGRVHTNDHASSWLATAGSGDVLAGLICGLLAQGHEPFEAARTGVWLHGEAGIRGGPGLIAEDLPKLIPAVLKDVLS